MITAIAMFGAFGLGVLAAWWTLTETRRTKPGAPLSKPGPIPLTMPELPPGMVWESARSTSGYSSRHYRIRIRDLQKDNKIVCGDDFFTDGGKKLKDDTARAARALYKKHFAKLPGALDPDWLGWDL